MTGPPRAVLFDVFGTLVDWRSGVARGLASLGERYGIACDWFAFADAWRGEYARSMNEVRHGVREWVNLDVLHGESFERLCGHFHIGPFDAAARRRAVRCWHALDAWPDAAEGLERLRERIPVATLSNGGVELLVNLTRHAGLRFDTLFSAEHFEHYKPDSQVYLGAAALLGCAPGDVMLVAAHPSDLRAAAACGLRTAHVSRPAEYGPVHEPSRERIDTFEFAVRDLHELAPALFGSAA